MTSLSILNVPVVATLLATWSALSLVSLVQPPDGLSAPQESTTEVSPLSPEDAAVEQDEVFVYDSEGRRDPFVSLFNRGTELPALGERPTGVAGLTVNEVALRGIVLSEGIYIAVLQAPDTTTYIVRSGEQLYDGSVQSITADAVIFTQEVNDPLSLVKEREVRVSLRGGR